jgi:hypothetical protein
MSPRPSRLTLDAHEALAVLPRQTSTTLSSVVAAGIGDDSLFGSPPWEGPVSASLPECGSPVVRHARLLQLAGRDPVEQFLGVADDLSYIGRFEWKASGDLGALCPSTGGFHLRLRPAVPFRLSPHVPPRARVRRSRTAVGSCGSRPRGEKPIADRSLRRKTRIASLMTRFSAESLVHE